MESVSLKGSSGGRLAWSGSTHHFEAISLSSDSLDLCPETFTKMAKRPT